VDCYGRVRRPHRGICQHRHHVARDIDTLEATILSEPIVTLVAGCFELSVRPERGASRLWLGVENWLLDARTPLGLDCEPTICPTDHRSDLRAVGGRFPAQLPEDMRHVRVVHGDGEVIKAATCAQAWVAAFHSRRRGDAWLHWLTDAGDVYMRRRLMSLAPLALGVRLTTEIAPGRYIMRLPDTRPPEP
jgi:hypothetical protein